MAPREVIFPEEAEGEAAPDHTVTAVLAALAEEAPLSAPDQRADPVGRWRRILAPEAAEEEAAGVARRAGARTASVSLAALATCR